MGALSAGDRDRVGSGRIDPELHPSSGRLTRRDLWIAGAVFAVTLASRLVFLFASADRAWPHSAFHEGDAVVWAEWAAAIDAGQERSFNSGLPFYPPAVAHLIAWLSPSGGPPDFVAIKVLWCGLNAAAVALAYLAFAGEFGRRVALIASALGAFSFGLGVISTSLNSETPYLLAVVGLVLVARRLAERPTLALAAVFGVLHGAANLIRAEHTLLMGLMAGWVAWRWWREAGPVGLRWTRSASMLALIGAAFVLTCLPWSLHATRANLRYNRGDANARFTPDYDRMSPAWTPDARAFFDALPEFCRRDTGAYLYPATVRRGLASVTADDLRRILLEDFGYIPEPVGAFTLIASSGPLAFALANHPDARGGFSKAALDPRFGGDVALGIPAHLRLYNKGVSVGLGFIREDPARWARNVGLKLRNFRGGVTLGLTARNLPLGRDGERRAVDMMTHDPGRGVAWRGAVTVAVLAGAIIAVRRRRAGLWLLVIASKIAVTILFFGYARQAVSILPAFLLLAAITIDGVVARMFASGVPRRFLVGVGAGALLVLVAGDVSALFARSVPRVEGPMRDEPRWGPGAFVSPETLKLRFSP